jgi:hypothetical protein
MQHVGPVRDEHGRREQSVRSWGFIMVVLLGCAGGCQAPVQRLRAAIHQVRAEAGEPDDSVMVYAVLSEDPPVAALKFFQKPMNRYIATVRFITVVITPREVTVYHKGVSRTYNLAPDRTRFVTGLMGQVYPESFSPDFESLCHFFTGDSGVFWETSVVCDLQLKPVEVEKSWSTGYPTLFKKYGSFTQDEYQRWLKSASEPSE